MDITALQIRSLLISFLKSQNNINRNTQLNEINEELLCAPSLNQSTRKEDFQNRCQKLFTVRINDKAVT